MAGLDENTKLLLQASNYGEEDKVASGSKEIIDSTGNHVVTQVGTASIVPNYKVFGNSCFTFDGTDDYLSIPHSSDFEVVASNTEDWTIDFWTKLNVYTTQYFMVLYNGGEYWRLRHDGIVGLSFQCRNSGAFEINCQETAPWSDTEWHHVAVVKKGQDYGIYVDGVQTAWDTESAEDTIGGGTLYIGSSWVSTTSPLDGLMDEIRIQKSNVFSASPNSGKTDEIDVPTSAHTSDSNTMLLLHADDLIDSSTGGTDSPHTVSANGNAHVIAKFGSGALTLDGNSDYLTIPASDDFNLMNSTTTTWTIDLWVHLTSSSPDLQSFVQRGSTTSSNRFVFLYKHSDSLRFQTVGGTSAFALTGGVMSLNKWHHVAYVKIGGASTAVHALYIDGEQTAYVSNGAVVSLDSNLWIGSGEESPTYLVPGFMDEVRIQNSNVFGATPNSAGTGDSITVPTSPYTADENTKLLLHMDTQDNSFYGGNH